MIDIEIVQACIFFQLVIVLSMTWFDMFFEKVDAVVLNVSLISTLIVSIQSSIIAPSLFEWDAACITISCSVTICTYLVTRRVVNKLNKKHGNKPIAPERTQTIEKYKNCKVYDAFIGDDDEKIITGGYIDNLDVAHEIIKSKTTIKNFKIIKTQEVYAPCEYQTGSNGGYGSGWTQFRGGIFTEVATRVHIQKED